MINVLISFKGATIQVILICMLLYRAFCDLPLILYAYILKEVTKRLQTLTNLSERKKIDQHL